MIMSFHINAKLASIYLVAIIILGDVSDLYHAFRDEIFRSGYFRKYDDLNASVQENIALYAWSRPMSVKTTK